MTDSRSPEQAPRPPEPDRAGVQGTPASNQTDGSHTPAERLEPPRNLLGDPSPAREQYAFRQTFLWRFHRPEVITAFRVVGDALCDLQNEAGAWGPKGDTPITWGELQAASEDLDHLVTYLDEVAGDRTVAELDEVSEALAVDAGRWAGQLARLVLDMRRSLDRAAEALAQDADDDNPAAE